ncbi:MAG: hypothetical protein PVF15_02480 [Candidatus Bathyarchaeota archaeon]|jgi:hypothetical protein
MNKKKRIGLLTFVIFIANMIITIIDAVVAVAYEVVPEQPSFDFNYLVIHGPVWWKINPIIIMTIIGVGLTAFFLGNNTKFSKPNWKTVLGYMPLVLTFVTISLSGLGDIISQTFIELVRGNSLTSWIAYEWWWTMYMPVPALVAALAGHNIPTGIDMLIGSTIGIIILCIMWLYYYEKLSFTKIKGMIWKSGLATGNESTIPS